MKRSFIRRDTLRIGIKAFKDVSFTPGITVTPAPVIRKWKAAPSGQFLAKLKEGDTVFLPQFQDKGTVVNIDRAKNTAKVKFGAVEVQGPVDSLDTP